MLRRIDVSTYYIYIIHDDGDISWNESLMNNEIQQVKDAPSYKVVNIYLYNCTHYNTQVTGLPTVQFHPDVKVVVLFDNHYLLIFLVKNFE